MGHLKDIANQPTRQSFPGAQFEAAGFIPLTQCIKAVVEGDHGTITFFGSDIVEVGKFTGLNLVNKFFTIISPVTIMPTQQIVANGDDFVRGGFIHQADSNDAVYYIHDGPLLETHHTAQTLMDFVLAAGYAATMKGGKLYTDMPSAELELACRILFDPLT